MSNLYGSVVIEISSKMDVKMIKPFEICFKLLKFYGHWMEAGVKNRVISMLKIILCPIGFLILTVYGFFGKEISLEMTDSITFFCGASVLVIRSFDCIYEHDNIQDFYDFTLEIGQKFVRKSVLIEKRLNFFFKLLIGNISNTYMSTISGFVMSIVTHEFPYPIAVPFNLDDTNLGFHLINFYLLISMCFIAPSYALLGMYPMFFMNFLIGFMEEFNEKLKNFGKINAEYKSGKEKNELIEKELKEIVEIHETMKIYVRKFSRIYEFSFFIEQVAASIILCTVLFIIILVSMQYNFIEVQFKLNSSFTAR